MLVWYKEDIIIISLKINLCSRHDIAEKLMSWHETILTAPNQSYEIIKFDRK